MIGPGQANPLRPRSVAELLNEAFELYSRHWKNLVAIVALLVVPLTLLQYFITDQVGRNLTQGKGRNGLEALSGGFWATALGSVVIGVMWVLIWAMLTGAVTRAAVGTFLGTDLDIGESYRFGLARLGSILLVGIVMALAIAGGFILFVVPGIFVLVRFTPAVPSLVVEGKRGGAALSRSWNLVSGHGWPVFGTMVVAWLLTGFVGAAFTAPFGNNWVARGVASSLASILTMPFTALVGALIYVDLRVRKEQLDLDTLRRDMASSGP